MTVRADGRVARAWAGAQSAPYALSEPMMVLATGPAPRAESVEVDWPSGLHQVLSGLPADTRHVITEPEVLAVSPAGRHARADGAALITLRVTPRRADGTPRDGVVEVRVDGQALRVRPRLW